MAMLSHANANAAIGREAAARREVRDYLAALETMVGELKWQRDPRRIARGLALAAYAVGAAQAVARELTEEVG